MPGHEIEFIIEYIGRVNAGHQMTKCPLQHLLFPLPSFHITVFICMHCEAVMWQSDMRVAAMIHSCSRHVGLCAMNIKCSGGITQFNQPTAAMVLLGKLVIQRSCALSHTWWLNERFHNLQYTGLYHLVYIKCSLYALNVQSFRGTIFVAQSTVSSLNISVSESPLCKRNRFYIRK